jgi:UDP-N-acetylglucosamine acyltransferase
VSIYSRGHPTAIIDPGARIAESAEIGPYSVIGADVEIGARTIVKGHVFMEGPLTIGEDNVFFPYSTVGVAPQDLKYKGERSELRIGNRNRIREFATLHRGTEGGGMVTSIGDDNLLMAYTHVAHDVQFGSHIVLSHAATLGGHVIVNDWAWIGAAVGVHQFCRIGSHAIVGGYSVITQDVLPFSNTVTAREAKVWREFNGPGTARVFFRNHRCAAQSLSPADAIRAQYGAGRGAYSRGSAAERRGLRSPFLHRIKPARFRKVSVLK